MVLYLEPKKFYLKIIVFEQQNDLMYCVFIRTSIKHCLKKLYNSLMTNETLKKIIILNVNFLLPRRTKSAKLESFSLLSLYIM